jgi:hypothetical protein
MKPQLTKLVDGPPEGPEWLHEIKFDGYRMHARLDRGAVRLLTRTASTGRKVPRPRIGDIVTSGKAGLSRRRSVRILARRNHFLQPDPERIRHREWRGACLFPLRPSLSRWRCPQPEAGQERKERLRALFRIMLWRCWASSEQEIARPGTYARWIEMQIGEAVCQVSS